MSAKRRAAPAAPSSPLAPGTPYDCRPHERALLGRFVPGLRGGIVTACATPTRAHPTERHVWVGPRPGGNALRVSVVRARIAQHPGVRPPTPSVDIEYHAALRARAERAGEPWRPSPPGVEFPHRHGSSKCAPTYRVWRELDALVDEYAQALEHVADEGEFERLLVTRLREHPRYQEWAGLEAACLERFRARQAARAPKAVFSQTREAARRRQDALDRGEDVTAVDYTDLLAPATRARKRQVARAGGGGGGGFRATLDPGRAARDADAEPPYAGLELAEPTWEAFAPEGTPQEPPTREAYAGGLRTYATPRGPTREELTRELDALRARAGLAPRRKTRAELERELKQLQARAAREGAPRRNPPVSSGALRELVRLLEGRGPRDTFAWMVANAPDGRLDAAWYASGEPTMLLRLYARTGDRAGLTRATCAAVRHALRSVPRGERRPYDAVSLAERWARGAAPLAAVNAASDAADAAARDLLQTRDRMAGGRSFRAPMSPDDEATLERAMVLDHAVEAADAAADTAAIPSAVSDAVAGELAVQAVWSAAGMTDPPRRYVTSIYRALPVPTVAQVLR